MIFNLFYYFGKGGGGNVKGPSIKRDRDDANARILESKKQYRKSGGVFPCYNTESARKISVLYTVVSKKTLCEREKVGRFINN